MIRAGLISIFFASKLLGADVDPRMVPPPDAIQGKLPTPPPIPAIDAAKTFRVLNGFRMDLLAAEPVRSNYSITLIGNQLRLLGAIAYDLVAVFNRALSAEEMAKLSAIRSAVPISDQTR